MVKIKKVLKKIPFVIRFYSFIKRYNFLNKTQKIFSYEEPIIKDTTKIHKVAIIGAGNMGIATYKALSTLKNVEVSAIIDISEESISRFKEKTKCTDIEFLTDIQHIFDRDTIDMVCVSTTAPSHMFLTKKLIDNGIKKILVEKPMSTSIKEAQEVYELAQEKGVTIGVNHSRRWSKNYNGIISLLKSKRYGDLKSAYLAFGKAGIGMMGVHYIDLLRYLFNSEVISVYAYFDEVKEENSRGEDYYDPSGRVWLTFESGARAFMDFSDDLTRKEKFLVLKTSHARFEIDELNENILIVDASGSKSIDFVHPDFSGYQRIKPVLASMLSGESPKSDVYDGLKAIEVLVAVTISAQNKGEKIELPLQDKTLNEFVLRIP